VTADPPEADIKRIVLERHLIFDDDAPWVRRWKFPPSRMRTWKKKFPRRTLNPGPREWILVALHQSKKPLTKPGGLSEWLDYLDHAIYSGEEITGMLESLAREGYARKTPDGWIYDRDALKKRRFIF